MGNLFIAAVLGHLIGDYLLQTKHMALQKSASGARGLVTCTLHVLTYTLAVCGMLAIEGYLSWLAAALVFVPHWVINRFSLASHWLKLIGGRTFDAAFNSTDKYREFDIAFTSIVYAVADNTLHLLCLWAVLKWIPG